MHRSRICALLITLLGVTSTLAMAQAFRSDATVEGRIVNGNAPEAKVRLVAVRASPLGVVDGYLGTVNEDGVFRFEDVAPGSYRLVAEAAQYLHAELGSTSPEQQGTVLEIRPGEHRTGLELRLVPDPPALCGRVVDADGRPVQATVEAFGRTGTGDGSRTRNQEPTKITGPDGRFLFQNLWVQGQYFLRANGVWYPGNRSYSQAQMLPPIQASQSACSTVIRIPRESCTGYQIRGNLEDKLAYPLFEYDVSLFETNDSGSLFLADSQPLYRADGFDFDVPCAGDFVAIVQDHWGGHWSAYASPGFAVTQRSTTVKLSVATQPELQKLGGRASAPPGPASVHGVFHLDGLDRAAACPTHVSQQIGLVREGEWNGVFSLVDSEGRFKFENLKPGRYALQDAYFAHGAAYVASFRIDGKETSDGRIELRPGQDAKVDITVSMKLAGARGRPLAGNSPLHYLPPGTHPSAELSGKLSGVWDKRAPVQLHAVRFNSANSTTYEATAAGDGTFHFAAVDPGIYVLETKARNGVSFAYGAKGANLEGTPVTLHAGQRRDGLVLEVPAESAPGATSAVPTPSGDTAPYLISGVVEGTLDPAAGPVFIVKAVPQNGPPYEQKYQQALGVDRRFKLEGVPAGRYKLMVMGRHSLYDLVVCSGGPCYALTEHVLAKQEIIVGPETASALMDMRLQTEPLATLEGEILLDGKVPDAARMRTWAPSLAKEFRGQSPAIGELASDGHFSLSLLDEGDYSFFINGFWPEYYIQSVLVDGRPIEGRRLHLSYGQSVHMLVNLATDGASGTLTQGANDPPVDPYTDVCKGGSVNVTRQLLIPDPLPSDNSGIVEGYQPFLNGVPPGRYRALAISNYSLSRSGFYPYHASLFDNHEFVRKLAALGTAVEIAPRQKFSITTPDRTEAAQQLLADMGVERVPD